MKKITVYYILPLLAAVFLILLDQYVKRWAYEVLRPVGEKPFIEGFLGFAYVENRGAAFGMLQGARWFFIPLTVAMLVFIGWYYVRLPKTGIYWLVRVPLVFTYAGAVGNFIDRLFQGYVVDMFEFQFISFPVFNVADMCLVAGTIAIAFVMLFIIKDKENA
jgi:signal peptidase II